MKRRNSYAVVTGASSGIGKEFAKRLAAEGYNLVLVARRGFELEKMAKFLRQIGGDVITVKADLSNINGCDYLLKRTEDLEINFFINNAGFGDCGYFSRQSIDKDLNMIDLNVKAVHYLTKRIIRRMEESDRGYILNVASSAGLLPAGPYMATYYATKSYVTSMTRAVARELKENGSNIYIGCLCPGPVDTEFNSVANVEFALKGITPSYCANYAVDMMKKRKVVIIPTFKMKMAILGGKFIPENLLIGITSHQQKKKMENKSN